MVTHSSLNGSASQDRRTTMTDTVMVVLLSCYFSNRSTCPFVNPVNLAN